MSKTRQLENALRILESGSLKELRASLTMSEHTLSADDMYRIDDAYQKLAWLTLDIVEEIIQGYPEVSERVSRICSPKWIAKCISSLYTEDVAVVMQQFKCVLQAIRHLSDNERQVPWFRRNYSVIQDRTYQTKLYFKGWGVCTSGAVWQLVQPFCKLLWVYDTPELFKCVNDLSQFICRLTLHDVDWIEEENIQAYIDFEEDLKKQEYDPVLVDQLRDIVTEWFSDFRWEYQKADHGYGATAEVRRSEGTTKKYHKMIPTVETARFTQWIDWTPCEIAWPGLTSGFREQLEKYSNGQSCVHSYDLTSKVQLVPKGVDKKRVISMEPTVHQFFQKIIGMSMDNHFQRHPEMRISLHDQSKNRSLAQRGSLKRDYATIDLSSASDSVTFSLVERVFRNTPLYYSLCTVRSPRTELPNGVIVDLEKYAPMGAGTCFPVECTIFSAIISLANKRQGVHTYYRVYGDDLVVHRDIYDEVIKLLQLLHFHVNEDKSFAPDAPFKESCGIECYKGVDVSPVRLSRKYDAVAVTKTGEMLNRTLARRKHAGGHCVTGRQVTACLPMLYKLGNDCLYHSRMSLRRHVIQQARDSFSGILFSHNEKMGFLTYSTNICIPNAKYRIVHPYSKSGPRGRVDIHSPGEEQILITVLRSKISEGESVSRYSKLIEEYSTTQRTSLLSYEDRIDCFAGAARTFYTKVWVPTAWLESYDLPVLSSGIVIVQD